MAISVVVPSNGAGGSATDGTVFTTGSITFVTGRLYLLATSGPTGFNLAAPTAAGTTSTDAWTSIRGQVLQGSNGRIHTFRYVPGSDHSETVTITFGVTQATCRWVVLEVTGADATGANGANAIVQSASAQGTAPTAVTLASFGNASNAVIGFHTCTGAVSFTVDATPVGYAELADGTSETLTMAAQWNTGEDTSVAGTWSSANNSGSVAMEIAIEAASGTPPLMDSWLVGPGKLFGPTLVRS